MTILLILAITIGIRHAFEPDHVTAVLTISTETNSLTATATQGAIWGIGHTITLFTFSMMLIGLQIEIDKTVFVLFEFVVGLILILMGISVIKKAKVLSQNNVNINKSTKMKRKIDQTRLSLKALGIGLLHGVTGSGVIMALISTTIDSIYLKFTYIALFSLGLIISMSLLSILMSIPLHSHLKLFPTRYFKVATGSLAILVGIKILYQSGIQINTLLI